MEPDIAIVVKDGTVIAFASAGKQISMRVIDLDEMQFRDYMPEVYGIDIEQYTKEAMKEC